MAWNDRLREAAYTSPNGTRLTFDYEDVRNTVDKKTTGFEFPDANGTFVQDLGHSGRRYPLRIFFWGADYDQEAEAFEALLLERGIGKLEHPIYGAIDVVPFGTITRRDDLKTNANQAVIELTFWQTINLVYPTAQTDPGCTAGYGRGDRVQRRRPHRRDRARSPAGGGPRPASRSNFRSRMRHRQAPP